VGSYSIFFAYLRKYFDCKDTQIFDTTLKLLTKICIRYLNRTNEPCGRQYDQMTQAARSVTANIAEGNCLIVLCNRLIMMLGKHLELLLENFSKEGGFTEALTAERLAFKTEQSIQSDAPSCPKCGKPMIKRVAKKGINAGNEFWSCSSYPECNVTRRLG
jgi:four helix bundle suffix protein